MEAWKDIWVDPRKKPSNLSSQGIGFTRCSASEGIKYASPYWMSWRSNYSYTKDYVDTTDQEGLMVIDNNV